MKTFTEISGPSLKEAYRWRQEMIQLKKTERGAAPPPPPEPPKVEVQPGHIKTPEERIKELEQRRSEEAKKRREEFAAILEEIKPPFLAKVKEKFTWPDERLPILFHALGAVDQARADFLRRILVLKPDSPEEPLPKDGIKIEDYVYVAEYLPPPLPKSRESDKKGPKGRRKGRDRGRPNERKFSKRTFAKTAD